MIHLNLAKDSASSRYRNGICITKNGKVIFARSALNRKTGISDLSKTNPGKLAEMKQAYQDWLNEMEDAEPRGPFRDF
jgi:hypothetical protein